MEPPITDFACVQALAVAQRLDARGLACPLPLLKAKLALRDLAVGECLQVLADDAGSWRDIPAFVRLSQHQLLGAATQGGEFIFVLEKR